MPDIVEAIIAAATGIVVTLIVGYGTIWKRLVSLEADIRRLAPVAKALETYGSAVADEAFQKARNSLARKGGGK